jgi:GAF domain-containing protein
MGSVEDELDIKTLNALRGTVDVERRLRIEMSTGTPSISDSAYAIKIRVKEDYKIVEKVVRKRRDKNDPLYNVDRLRDIVGLRIVTLYRLDALTIIPLLLEKIATGSKSSSGLFMREVLPFTDKQITLLRTFADQAVIAIENTRLFEEVQARNRELTESLEQQTATSEILRVISSSPTDIRPVLDAVGENAARLCDANNAVVYKLEGDILRQVSSYGGLPTTSHPTAGLPVNRDRVTGRAVFDRQTIHVHDLAIEDAEFPEGSKDARRDGHRTTLATPLLREGVPLGAILIRRMEVRPFSERQIKLLETFANQAAIAINNVGLFEQVQARSRELSESLEQQTATADVLKVISRSTFDLQQVFDTLIEAWGLR